MRGSAVATTVPSRAARRRPTRMPMVAIFRLGLGVTAPMLGPSIHAVKPRGNDVFTELMTFLRRRNVISPNQQLPPRLSFIDGENLVRDLGLPLQGMEAEFLPRGSPRKRVSA